MFRSIFARLLITYIILIITIAAVLYIIVSGINSQYLFENKRKSFDAAAYKAGTIAESYLNNKTSQEELNTALDSMGIITESSIYVIKASKKDFQKSNNVNIGNGLNEAFIRNSMTDIMNGKVVFVKRQYSSSFQQDVIFAGYPLRTGTSVIGAILIFSPVSSVDTVLSKMNLYFLISALVIVFLSSLLIYINSIKITRPIKSLEKQARRLADGESTEILASKGRDEIGKLINSFNEMKIKLESNEKMRRDFLANVSHDLRTPLTSINGFVQGMMDGLVEPDQYKEYLGIIKQETNRLISLTGDILELAKIQSKNINLKRQIINVKDSVDNVTGSLRQQINYKSIDLCVSIHKDLYINADPDRIEQILMNIISNAIKYSRQNGRIAISTQKLQKETTISVEDNGIGISQADIPYVFEKFYRADKVRNSQEGGTGLGLNIAKSLVELHGGAISVQSTEAQGTKISFTIPVYN